MHKQETARSNWMLVLTLILCLGFALTLTSLVQAQPLADAASRATPLASQEIDGWHFTPSVTADIVPQPSYRSPDISDAPEVTSPGGELVDVPGATDDWWAGVQARLRRESYRLSPDPDGQWGYNRAHNFVLDFGPSGLRLSPNEDHGVEDLARPWTGAPHPLAGEKPHVDQGQNREAWSWALSLASCGYMGELRPVGQPLQATARGNRFEYRYPSGIVEWYINDKRGLEHGFTLPAPPQSEIGSPAKGTRAKSEIVLDLALDTSLTPHLSPDKQTIDFFSPGHPSAGSGPGIPVLRYDRLLVTDATGRQLPAHFSLSLGGEGAGHRPVGEGKILRIVIDDADAVYPLTVDPLASSPSWTATGENGNDSFGWSVESAGDVNGDGYADVIVGALSYFSPNLWGRAYVYHGSDAGLSVTPALTLTGQNSGDQFGCSVASAGDVNGDGYADAIVGAQGYPGFSQGKVYVYHGSAVGLTATPALTLTAENVDDNFGHSVASAGDVNGDGYADAIVGASGYPSGGGQGIAYVYHGSDAGLAATPALTLTGTNNGDRFGSSVASAGDVNGDGYADAIVGVAGYPSGSNRGRAYVYHGSAVGLAATPVLTLTGENSSDQFGRSVASAGDVNGDGYADAIVGASGYSSNRGRAYVYHGSGVGLASTPTLILTGVNTNDFFGDSVASAGDVNGDGYADAIVGAHGGFFGSSPGRAYVYNGSGVGLAATPALTLTGENNGDEFGSSVASAGDVNGDGYADALVGAKGYPSGSHQGRAYAYHGSGAGLAATPALTATGENNNDRFGYSVAGAGDVNGDGYADAIVGAPDYPNGSDQGRVYIYHGSGAGLGATPALTLTGENNGDSFGDSLAGVGDVNGDGYADVIVGAFLYSSNDQGAAYVYYGSGAGLTTTPALTLTGENTNDYFGRSVASAGDVNGDGYADVIVGAYYYPSGSLQGRVYVYHGSSIGLVATPALTLTGENSSDSFGRSVASAGDVNGDGYADTIVGASNYSSGQGAAYVYYGSDVGLAATPALTLTGENNGDHFGYSVASAGDVNGDGYADAIVGAYGYAGSQGRAYIYHGSGAGLGAMPALTLTGENTDDNFGVSVASVGDVNGDGYADTIVGAFGYPSLDLLGAAYVYHGSGVGLAATPTLTLTGENNGDFFGWSVASAGDVNGDGYADAIVGAYRHSSSDQGAAYVYNGNDGGGRTVLARQARGDGSETPVQAWGLSYAPDGFQVQLRATDPRGRGRVKLQVETCSPGTAFGDVACTTHTAAAWTDVTTAAGGVTLTEVIPGLAEETLYRWRARVLYAPQTVTAAGITPPPNPAHGPWRRLNGQAVEADVRTSLPLPDLAAVKTVTPTTAAPGETLTYTYRVTNSGNVSLSGIVAVDDALGAVSLGASTLAPNAWTTGTLTYTVDEGDLPGPLTNTVVVTGSPSAGGDVTATHSASVILTGNPAIAVSKVADPTTANVGDTITYTYRLTNSGNVSLSDVVAVDDALGPVSLGASTLAPGAWTTGTLTHVVVEGDLPGSLVNTVVVTGTPTVGGDVSASDSASVILTGNPAIAVSKVADPATASVGQTITYTYRVTNSGDVSLSGIVAVDDVLGAVSLGASSLTPDDWTTGTLTYLIVEGDLPGPLVNTVVVTGTPTVGGDVSASDSASAALISGPAIAVSKVADPATASVGQTITYTYRVTNSGDVSLSGVVAVDDVLGPVSLGASILAPDAWTTGVLMYTVVESDLPGPLANTVVVTGTPQVGANVNSTDDAIVILVETDYLIWLPIVLKSYLP